MSPMQQTAAYLALLLNAAIFGFFYAYVCSAMWGLDQADPRIAIPAMQAINGAVRNAAFMPAFFITPLALGLVAVLVRKHRAWPWWAAAGLCYFIGGLVLTMAINVPMNEELALLVTPESKEAAAAIWAEFSPDWQFYNLLRTVFSGISLCLALTGLVVMARP